jgi:hypothetical protein
MIALLLSGCSSAPHVITPADCYKSCNNDGAEYVGIIYAAIVVDDGKRPDEMPTLEKSQAGCLCRQRTLPFKVK